MTEKRFTLENDNLSNIRCNILDYGYGYTNKGLCDLLNELHKENEQLKYKINDLLYQIEYVGKNNKSCDRCECFLEDIGYCWMWDMNVKKEDIVVACDKRKVI